MTRSGRSRSSRRISRARKPSISGETVFLASHSVGNLSLLLLLCTLEPNHSVSLVLPTTHSAHLLFERLRKELVSHPTRYKFKSTVRTSSSKPWRLLPPYTPSGDSKSS